MNKINAKSYHLFVLRHGKASDQGFGRDFNRALVDKGIEQAEKVGQWMASRDLEPDLVLTSPAKRAFMTADIVTQKLNIGPQKIQLVQQIYEANLDTLLKVLAGRSTESHAILLVGHNPSLEYLLDYLLSASITSELADDNRLLPATLVHLEMKVNWSQLAPDCAQRVSITYGKFLP